MSGHIPATECISIPHQPIRPSVLELDEALFAVQTGFCQSVGVEERPWIYGMARHYAVPTINWRIPTLGRYFACRFELDGVILAGKGSRSMTPPRGHQPMFYYVIEVKRREFPLVIMPDGVSHWDDHTERRALRRSEDQLLELYALAGDSKAIRQLGNELLEFTISVRVPDRIMYKAREMDIKERFGRQTRLGVNCAPATTMQDIAEMDRLLLDIFWKHINPLLSHPIER